MWYTFDSKIASTRRICQNRLVAFFRGPALKREINLKANLFQSAWEVAAKSETHFGGISCKAQLLGWSGLQMRERESFDLRRKSTISANQSATAHWAPRNSLQCSARANVFARIVTESGPWKSAIKMLNILLFKVRPKCRRQIRLCPNEASRKNMFRLSERTQAFGNYLVWPLLAGCLSFDVLNFYYS